MEKLVSNLSTLGGNPSSIAALIGLIAFILAYFYIKKISLNTRLVVHIGLALALTVILHTFRLYHMPQGGSITFGAMVPLLLISFRYGPGVGYLTGFVYGFFDLLHDPYILHPIQVLFDYPLPFMALGLAGYFQNKPLVGAIAGVLGRFVCHFISGVVFFASYAPAGVSPYWYSLIFNATYLVPELVICLLILKVLPATRLVSFMAGQPK
ncbi:MAG: proton-coupled thiamine transporter YuaJ [Firmicutes bacterium]|nr:proton-coupled thiamine transporter YuaJ [Bacillota bacterium]